MGGAHQQQECRQLDSSKPCCFQVTLHKAVTNNQLLGSVRARRVRDATIEPHPRSAQDAVVGSEPLPASPTPFHSMGEEQDPGVFAAEWPNLLPWGEGGAGVAGDGRGARIAATKLPLLALTPFGAVLPQEDITQSGAQQLTVGSVPARRALDSTRGSHRRFAQGAVVGSDPLPASPTPFHSMGEEPIPSCGAESSECVDRQRSGRGG